MSIRKAIRSRNIYTAVSEELLDGYVVIEGNQILAAGTEDETKKYLTSETEILNYKDQFIMPGFHDFHVHLLTGAMLEYGGVLRYADSEEEAAKILWETNKDRKNQEWILGGAWDHFRWQGAKLPGKESLDKYFQNTKVFSLNKECHSAWVNSAVLKYFNITKDTPDPVDGYYGRDENGELTGYIHEAAMFPMLSAIFDSISDEDIAEFTKTYAAIANSYGITSVGDVAIGNSIREKAYLLPANKGELNIRVNFAKPMMSSLEDLLEAKKEYSGYVVRFIGAKDFIDGTPMGHSGFMLDDYTDQPGFRSNPMIEPEVLKDKVSELHKNNIKVRLHACGDGGVRLCLDAFEEAIKRYGKKDLRHCIEHIEVTTPSDIERFAELGVIPSVQPEHLPKYNFYNHPFIRMIGTDRMQYSWPFETLRKSGAVLAYGTDYPVVEMNPFKGIYRSVTRLTNEGEPEGGFNPKEKVSIHETLKAYTYGSAYAANLDSILGTLEPGKLADIVILEENLFECAENRDKMFRIKPLMTIMDGRVVYQR